jgi:hypothetical protein
MFGESEILFTSAHRNTCRSSMLWQSHQRVTIRDSERRAHGELWPGALGPASRAFGGALLTLLPGAPPFAPSAPARARWRFPPAPQSGLLIAFTLPAQGCRQDGDMKWTRRFQAGALRRLARSGGGVSPLSSPSLGRRCRQHARSHPVCLIAAVIDLGGRISAHRIGSVRRTTSPDM